MRRILVIAPCLALAAVLCLRGPVAADDAPVPLRATGGDSLTAAEDREVRATLLHYLEAVRVRDWREAAKDVDRASFLKAVEPMVEAVAPDPALRAAARRTIFGASTFDSLEKRPLPDLFAGMMNYVMTADPHTVAMMEKAKFNLLAARKIRGRVHIAYTLTVPSESDTTQPYVRVTAERLIRDGDRWKILIAQDHGGGRATR